MVGSLVAPVSFRDPRFLVRQAMHLDALSGGRMVLGVGAVATVGQWPDLWLGAGFGGLQIIFGIIITRKHGG